MRERVIAIVGSADERRHYDPPMQDAAGARKTAEALGTALAESGHRLTVYSAEAGLIEPEVVRGFVKSGKAKPGSIVVMYPADSPAAAAFPEYSVHRELFDLRPDNSIDWEVAFYRSLQQADGVVLIGGGRSTLITGVLALAHRIPLVAVAAHGGNAKKVWASLVAGRDLPTQNAIDNMARPSSLSVVRKWVESLEEQRQEKDRQSKMKSRVLPAVAALALLIAWVSALPIGFWLSMAAASSARSGGFTSTALIFFVFLTPLLSGASGATIRMLASNTTGVTIRTTVLGTAAAAVASVLYVSGQLLGKADPRSFAVLAFSVVFGFIAGFTFDSVFKKLETVQTLRSDVLTERQDHL